MRISDWSSDVCSSDLWWTYDVVIGPAIDSDRGQLPLIFPVLLGLWAGGLVALLVPRDAQGFRWHERALHVNAISPGWKREAARAAAFILLFQISMLDRKSTRLNSSH